MTLSTTLKDYMKLKKVLCLHLQKINEAKKALLNMLENEGYINSVVEIDIEKLNEHSVTVTFNVNKGDEIIIKKANYYGAENLDEDDFEEVTANNEEEFASWWFGQNDGEVKIDELKYDSRRINELYSRMDILRCSSKRSIYEILILLQTKQTLDLLYYRRTINTKQKILKSF